MDNDCITAIEDELKNIKNQNKEDEKLFEEKMPRVQALCADFIGKLALECQLNTALLVSITPILVMAILGVINAKHGESDYNLGVKIIQRFLNEELKEATKKYREGTTK
jgi:phosphate/sulfate permease